jgi:gas vesicle protein
MFGAKSKHSYVELFEGIIIGGSLAAAASFIFGTKKGKELQKGLVHQYKKLGYTTKSMKQKIEKVIKKAKTSKHAIKTKSKKASKKVKAKIKTSKR